MDRHPGRFTLQFSRVVLTQCGSVAEWLCSGLQLRVRRFDSDPSLQFTFCVLTSELRARHTPAHLGQISGSSSPRLKSAWERECIQNNQILIPAALSDVVV